MKDAVKKKQAVPEWVGSKKQAAARTAAHLAAIRARRKTDPALMQQHEEFVRNYDLAMQLHRLRKRCRKTQAEIAAIIGVSQSAVARIESGRALRLDTIYRYAAACGCADIRLRLEESPRARAFC